MYTLIRTYDDGFSQSEICHTISEVFTAAGIYTADKECVSILAINNATKDFIIDFNREAENE